MQEPRAQEARNAGQYGPTVSQGTRLLNAVELRLFRYTTVLFSLVVLAALAGIIIWAFGWLLETFYTLLPAFFVGIGRPHRPAGDTALNLYERASLRRTSKQQIEESKARGCRCHRRPQKKGLAEREADQIKALRVHSLTAKEGPLPAPAHRKPKKEKIHSL